MTHASPVHFGRKEAPLFGWYHAPQNELNRGLGLVLCNTLGNESLRVHRSLRHLAEKLAAQGFAVMRFDFDGTGDSLGEITDTDQVKIWLNDIRFATEELKKRSGFSKISIFGVRLGATLATQSASVLGEIEDLILWEPCLSGKDFVRESSRQHKMLISLSPSGFTLDRPGGIEGGKEFLGFYINNATLKNLETLDLSLIEKRPARNVLTIGSLATAGNFQKALDHFESQGSLTEYQQIAGFQGIFREALFSEVPFQVLDGVVKWLTEKHVLLENQAPAEFSENPIAGAVKETPLFFGKSKRLFGILTSPSEETKTSTVMIIVNAGVGTHIGPHRLYVQMARDWAALGFHTFRVDLAGSGESTVDDFKEESSPYPKSSISDVEEAVSFLKEKYALNRFMITGTCSGADIAFRAAAQDSRVSAAIVINPRSFCTYNFPELELHIRAHYLQSTLIRKKNWVNILKGGLGSVDRVGQVIHSAAFKLKTLAEKKYRPSQDASWPVKDVPENFNKILKRGSQIFLLISEGDPGMEYVNIHFPKEMQAFQETLGFRRIYVQGTDHLFTLKHAREQVLKTIRDYLSG
jgi:alpha-beta hydrolase superfamily lysophospholipase